MKKVLGKGLGALLTVDEEEKEVAELKINDVEPNMDQPRKEFDEDGLRQLAESIKTHGVIQPVIVRKQDNGYRIVAGERRWRAARIAGCQTIPVIIREYSDRQLMEIALVENLQREDLNPMEEAEAYKKLMEDYSLTQEDIAGVIGKSRSAIANSLRLNRLEKTVKKYVRENKLSEGHARALLAFHEDKEQLEAAEKIVKNILSVRDTENMVRKAVKKPKNSENSKNQDLDIEVKNIEDKLKDILGTKVRLQYGNKRGKIVIEYYSNDELERIIGLMDCIG